MKKEIIKHKDFLKKVLKAKKLENLLNKASSEQLNSLIYALNFVVTKKVPLPEKINEEILKLKNDFPKLKKFNTIFHENIDIFLNEKKNKKIKHILNYEAIIKKALLPYFKKQ